MSSVDLETFMELAKTWPVFDVRTHAEFVQGRIPGAHSLPLFNEQERAIVGTIYKQVGKDEAVLKGLELVGPKLRAIVEQVGALAPERRALVHCWRGGMRSGSVGWLLKTAGFEVHTLEGGYKRFRRWSLEQLEQPRPIMILGGLTGSGKTELLHELAAHGEQIIDLEGIAHHRGSAFGAVMMPEQPSNEQFENELATQWAALDPARLVWLEDESRNVGRCFLPERFWAHMSAAPVLVVKVSDERRIEHLVKIYGAAPHDALVQCFEGISRRLGGERTREALKALEQGELHEAARLALSYYDKTYLYGLHKRPEAQRRELELAPSGAGIKEIIALGHAWAAEREQTSQEQG